jgi:hypothetical protein
MVHTSVLFVAPGDPGAFLPASARSMRPRSEKKLKKRKKSGLPKGSPENHAQA